jgi:hypothetical protein
MPFERGGVKMVKLEGGGDVYRVWIQSGVVNWGMQGVIRILVIYLQLRKTAVRAGKADSIRSVINRLPSISVPRPTRAHAKSRILEEG